jgi:hypothetical protein
MVVLDWVVVIAMTRYAVSTPLQAKQIFLMYKRYKKKNTCKNIIKIIYIRFIIKIKFMMLTKYKNITKNNSFYC